MYGSWYSQQHIQSQLETPKHRWWSSDRISSLKFSILHVLNPVCICWLIQGTFNMVCLSFSLFWHYNLVTVMLLMQCLYGQGKYLVCRLLWSIAGLYRNWRSTRICQGKSHEILVWTWIKDSGISFFLKREANICKKLEPLMLPWFSSNQIILKRSLLFCH